jgi:bifunctional non-homologous end joining protein LigD
VNDTGRSGAWVKVKCLDREEFVVIGWTPPAGSRSGIGALHVGYYDPPGKLHYAGGVGTGFSNNMLNEWGAPGTVGRVAPSGIARRGRTR